MSISNAMQTGVSGLKANLTAIGRISDNIANANTDGYRRSFAQMVTSTTRYFEGQPASGVRAESILDMARGGSVRSTDRATDMAISGGGFFVVSKTPNDPVESNYMLTRAGSFLPDANGDLRNSAGFYLAGYALDDNGSLGTVDRNTFGDLTTINIGDMTLPGNATSAISIAGNLPAQETGVTAPGDPFQSSTEFFSPLGASDRLQFSWQPTATANQWDLTFSDSLGTPIGMVTADFNDSGTLAGSPSLYSGATSFATAPVAFAFDTSTGVATLTLNTGSTPQVVTVAVGALNSFDGMSQFAGDYSPLGIETNGSASGTLQRTEIDQNGDVYGIFDNGGRKALYRIPVANVPNPSGMLVNDGNTFLLSRDSGDLRLDTAGEGATGTIMVGVLESSNVEIAEELTNLIQTQRAYSSNAKIITTVDEMLDETMRLKR